MKIKTELRNGEISRINFTVETGGEDHVMFSVEAGQDGRSLEIRGIDTCRVGKKVFMPTLIVKPNVSNSITIRTEKYES